MSRISTSLYLCISFLLCGHCLLAQVAHPSGIAFDFSNQTNRLVSNKAFSDYVVGVVDVDKNGLDDIILLQGKGRELEIHYQQADRTFIPTYEDAYEIQQFNVAVADVNNQGGRELSLGDSRIGQRIFSNGGVDSPWNTVTLEGSSFEVQGANFVDIDADGLLDIFVCHDEGTSVVWRNTGNGFEKDIDLVGLNVHGSDSKNAGNYSSIWSDVDSDGDLDLYISKCYGLASSRDDTRRLNQLFINEGANGFREAAAEAGLDDKAQSWTADFQDIDNDGDLDCYVVNHEETSRLYENVGNGEFIDITDEAGLNFEEDKHDSYLQAFLRDLDSDGLVDLLVCGKKHRAMYRNMGDNVFEFDDSFNDSHPVASFAFGDLNHDGYLDIYSSAYKLVGESDQKENVLWINEITTNNFLAIDLEGVNCNRDAIGARLEIYGSWGVQVREVRSGEGYGVMNSFTQHFGLGQNETVDSLIIRWPAPSAWVDKYENVSANQFFRAVEGQCLFADNVIHAAGSLRLCGDESVVLTAPKGDSFLWSTGETSSSIEVNTAGSYQVTVTNEFGCVSECLPVVVEVDPIAEVDIKLSSNRTLMCSYDTIGLVGIGAESYVWSTGDSSAYITITEGGTYSFEAVGLCGERLNKSITIDELIPPDLNAYADTVRDGSRTTTLYAQGGNNPRWFSEEGLKLGFVEGRGDSLTVGVIGSVTFYVESVITEQGLTCRDYQPVEVVVLATSVSEVVEGISRLYPNPTDRQITIELQAGYRAESFELYDSFGQRLAPLQSASSVSDQYQLNLPDLASGVYWLQVQHEKGRSVQRFVVNR